MTGKRRTIYMPEEDWESVESEASGERRSVSWYLMELHRKNVGSVKREKPVVVPKENLKPVVQRKAAKPPEAPEPTIGEDAVKSQVLVSEDEVVEAIVVLSDSLIGPGKAVEDWRIGIKPMPKGGKK